MLRVGTITFTVPDGAFENGDSIEKIVKNFIIEGRVFYVVQWKAQPNKLRPNDTILLEGELKEALKPRTFKKIMKDFMEDSD